MTEPTVLASGLAMGESPRWHDDRLWVCDWVAGSNHWHAAGTARYR